MPSPLLAKLRTNSPAFQGLSDVDLLNTLRRDYEKQGGSVSPQEMDEAYQAAGLTKGSSLSGFLRGAADGLNPIPTAITNALLPEGAAKWIAGLGEVRPGEEGSHQIGEMAGMLGGTLLPLGLIGKAGKALGAVNEAGQLSRGLKAAMLGTQGTIGALQGAKMAGQQGQYYPDGTGAAATGVGALTGAAMNMVPELTGLSKVLGVNAGLGAAQAGVDNLIQYHNGKAQGFEPSELAMGAAQGAAFGGVLHGAFHGLPSFVQKRLATAERTAAGATPSPELIAKADPAKPALARDPLPEQFASQPSPQGLSPAEQIAFQEYVRDVEPMLTEIEQLKAARDYKPARVFAQDRPISLFTDLPEFGPHIVPFAGETRVGDLREAFIQHPERGPMAINGRDYTDHWYKRFQVPELSDAEVVVGKGFVPMDSAIPDRIGNTHVLVVGKNLVGKGKDLQRRFLVVDPQDKSTWLHPQEVPIDALENLKQTVAADRAKAIAGQDPMALLQGDRGKKRPIPVSLAERRAQILNELENLRSGETQRQAIAGTRTGNPAAAPAVPFPFENWEQAVPKKKKASAVLDELLPLSIWT